MRICDITSYCKDTRCSKFSLTIKIFKIVQSVSIGHVFSKVLKEFAYLLVGIDCDPAVIIL